MPTPEAARSGKAHDPESEVVKPGGDATTRGKLGLDPKADRNGEAPRDRGNRAV
jgi:hypothetical protein